MGKAGEAEEKLRAASPPQDVFVIRYPAPEDDRDPRENYEWQVLREVLEATEAEFGPYRLEAAPVTGMKRNPVDLMLQSGSRIHVLRKASTKVLEDLLIPVRIPLLKGILGYRVFIIHKDFQDDLLALKSVDELKEIPMIQASAWNDTAILRHNGFTLEEGEYYRGFFQMVQEGRVPLFPRAIHEAPLEVRAFSEDYPDLRVDSRYLLRYPFYEYFFVSPDFPQLARRLEKGLIALRDQGRLDELFSRYIGPYLEVEALLTREIIDLENPFSGEPPEGFSPLSGFSDQL